MFAEIGGIADHHCLHFLYIISLVEQNKNVNEVKITHSIDEYHIVDIEKHEIDGDFCRIHTSLV